MQSADCVYHRRESTGKLAMAMHFLANILSSWKNQPSLVRVGGAHPPPFTLSSIPSKLGARLQLRGHINSYFFSTLFSSVVFTFFELNNSTNFVYNT